MKKIIVYIGMLLLPSTLMFADEIEVQLSIQKEDQSSTGGRSLQVDPTATLDGTEFTLSYPLPTESQVMLIDQSTQTTVYSETFAASRSVIIDLAEEGLGEGTYMLRIYAFGKWWWGEFEIEEDY